MIYAENNRIIVDHLSSLLFCPTQNSIEKFDLRRKRRWNSFSGDIMFDNYVEYGSLDKVRSKPNSFGSKYILATIHPEEKILKILLIW